MVIAPQFQSGPFGAASTFVDAGDALVRARERAQLMPDLLVDARRIAANVTMGWHGRRKRGTGNEFWQYRPYSQGESQTQIDWRRSARDDQTFIRDREWEAAHTVWIWADQNIGMAFKSRFGDVSKQSRALVLALAMAELASRAGERIGWPGLMQPVSAQNGAERLAARLMALEPAKPDWSRLKQRSDAVLLSDFMSPLDEQFARYNRLLERGVRGHLVMVLDPVEEVFPYQGETEFRDPITGARHHVGRAEQLQEEYHALFLAHCDALSRWCRQSGWSFTRHKTDEKATTCLTALFQKMEMVTA